MLIRIHCLKIDHTIYFNLVCVIEENFFLHWLNSDNLLRVLILFYSFDIIQNYFILIAFYWKMMEFCQDLIIFRSLVLKMTKHDDLFPLHNTFCLKYFLYQQIDMTNSPRFNHTYYYTIFQQNFIFVNILIWDYWFNIYQQDY